MAVVDPATTLLVRPSLSDFATTIFEAVSCDLQLYESKVEFWRVLVESGGVGVESTSATFHPLPHRYA
jgi:hypothetical protein